MLLQFRHVTRGAIASIILGLVGLAMVIFLIPQGGLQIFPSQDLATVGNRSIQAPALTRELQLALRQQRAQGNNMSQTEAIEAGAHVQILESMISRYALYEYADKLGVSASDATVAARIRDIPAVTNPVTHQFDQAAYDAFLQQLGYTRPAFEDDIRGDLTTAMLMEAMLAGVRAPASYGALAFAYETEQRVITVAEAPANVVGQIAAPTPAQLQSFYEESQERLRVPEFRAVTLVVADPADFAARADVPEARLREEFEARRAALARPEQRTYVRLAAPNQEQANQAAARIGRGENPQTVAQSMGLQLARGENQPRTEVPDRGVADALFAMQRGQVRVVQGQLAPWVVVRLESITPPTEPNFDSMRAELRQAIAADAAADLLNTAVSAFEDARSGGATVADAARQQGLRVVTIPAIEAQGRAPNGEPVEALASQPELLRTVFQTPEGEASDFIPAGNADVIVSVDRVTPSTIRPLAEVRDQLTQVWIARERSRRMRELAEHVQQAVRGGQTFAAAARANHFAVVPPQSQPIDRRTASRALPGPLASQIFAAAPGDVVSIVSPDGGAVLVAHIERVNRQDPAEQPQVVEQLRGQMQQGLIQSVGQAVQGEIVAKTHIRRNEALLNQLFPRGNQEGQEGQEGQAAQ
jgi:peptidyl-prolyl cis-trans isomerase D